MTEIEIHNRATGLAKILAPSVTSSPTDSLYHISVARQTIEEQTGVVKRRAAITLNAPATGEYALPADFRALDTVKWAPDANTPAVWPVIELTESAFQDRVRQSLTNPPQVAPMQLPNSGGAVYISIGFGQTSGDPHVLSVFPKETTGRLVMRYKPHLTIYSPMAPEWAEYLNAVEAKMAANANDESLKDCESGIVSWVVAQILRQQKEGTWRFAKDIRDHERRFEDCINAAARNALDKAVHTTPQRLRPMGGMR